MQNRTFIRRFEGATTTAAPVVTQPLGCFCAPQCWQRDGSTALLTYWHPSTALDSLPACLESRQKWFKAWICFSVVFGLGNLSCFELSRGCTSIMSYSIPNPSYGNGWYSSTSTSCNYSFSIFEHGCKQEGIAVSLLTHRSLLELGDFQSSLMIGRSQGFLHLLLLHAQVRVHSAILTHRSFLGFA